VVKCGNANVGITCGGKQFELVVEQRHGLNYLKKQKRPEGRCVYGAKVNYSTLALARNSCWKAAMRCCVICWVI
jgi:hypothetical protein